MPGVVVTTNVQSGQNTALQSASGQLFLVGQTERGVTTEPIRLRNVSDVDTLIGGRVAYSDLYDQLLTFFNEGGRQAFVKRVVGAGATSGTLSLTDRAASPIGTLRIDASSPGAWSAGLTVEVLNGPVTNTFRIVVRLNGNVVEDKNNLVSPEDAILKFNGSSFVKVTSLGSTSTAPTNNPAVRPATALTAGTDNRGTVTSADYITALDYYTDEYADGAVAIPGQTGQTIWESLIKHAKDHGRVALLAASKTETSGNLQTQAATLNSEYAGLFAPWVIVPTVGGATRTISPEGYVAAARARAHDQVGPWRAPAGQMAIARYVTGVDQVFTSAQSEDLDAAKVNVIRNFANTVRLYGWRSLSNDTDNWTYLKDRDLLNRLTYEAAKRLEKFIFETIDNHGHLLSLVNAELVGMIDPIAKANGLFASYDADGNEIDPGYVVNTGADINTTSTLVQNTVNAIIKVRISPVGSFFNLTITKVGLLGGLS